MRSQVPQKSELAVDVSLAIAEKLPEVVDVDMLVMWAPVISVLSQINRQAHQIWQSGAVEDCVPRQFRRTMLLVLLELS